MLAQRLLLPSSKASLLLSLLCRAVSGDSPYSTANLSKNIENKTEICSSFSNGGKREGWGPRLSSPLTQTFLISVNFNRAGDCLGHPDFTKHYSTAFVLTFLGGQGCSLNTGDKSWSKRGNAWNKSDKLLYVVPALTASHSSC